MMQGVSGREEVQWEILSLLYKKQATTKELRKNCSASKATFYKYLNELWKEGKIICMPQRGRGNDVYTLSKESREETKLWLEKQPLLKEIEQMTSEEILRLKHIMALVLAEVEFPDGTYYVPMRETFRALPEDWMERLERAREKAKSKEKT